MKKIIESLFESFWIKTIGLISIFMTIFADYTGKRESFMYVFVVLLVFFSIAIFKEFKERKIKQETLHVPLVIKIGDGAEPKYVLNGLVKQIEKRTGYLNYKSSLSKYFTIDLDDYIFIYNDSLYDFEKLMSFARIIRYEINKLEKKFYDKKIKFHIAYYRRPAVAFLLGTIFRIENVIFYQNNDADKIFYPVLDIKDRNYKSHTENYEKYIITKSYKNENNNEVLIAIESASHSIALSQTSLNKFENIIKIKLKDGVTIPYEIDWVNHVVEIYSIINKAQTKFKKITIAHSMPEALALTLGMAMENYWNVDITQYEEFDYKFMFNMSKITF